MGRRAKSELLDLTERIIKLYTVDHKTIVEIEELLRGEGIDISREAIRHSVKSSKEVAQKFSEATAEAKILIDTVRNNPNTDVLEATTTLLSRHLFEFVRSVDNLDFDDPVALANAVSTLSTSQAKIAKLRMDYEKGFEAAKKAVLDALKAELKAYPDIAEKLAVIVAGLAPEVK